MTSSDLDVLIDMGFERERAELAVKKSGGLQGAIDWLESVQDKSLEDLKASAASSSSTAGSAPPPTADNDNPSNIEPPALKPGEVAHSLLCEVCQRKFRSQAQAEFHAEKTGHQDFAESTEEIAPLTEEEKRQKLEELRQRLADKRAGKSDQDKVDQKRNEEIRRKSTKQTQDIKEDLAKKELLKEAAAKKREKQADVAAKEKIKAKIAADKEERRLKAEKEKAEREGRAVPIDDTPAAPVVAATLAATSKPASAYTETRLRFQTLGGNIQKSLPVDTTLFEVASMLQQESGVQVQSFVQNYPKKVFDQVDFGSTLKELGLVPSAALIVR
ncbi:hypothetical protein MMC25_001984 [Agyrium rufum]|nr:hypothetical protein [Agyrium rufum]